MAQAFTVFLHRTAAVPGPLQRHSALGHRMWGTVEARIATCIMGARCNFGIAASAPERSRGSKERIWRGYSGTSRIITKAAAPGTGMQR